MNKYADIKCICGNSNYKRIFKGTFNRYKIYNYHFEILRCKNCNLVRTYPVPDIHKVKKDIAYSFMTDIEEHELHNPWAIELVKTAKKYISSGNLLDIGCFSGKMLEEAEKEGFEAYGVELYEEAVAYGRKKGRNITLGELYNANFDDYFFDVIIMNHVFEHVHDPIKLIKEIDRILKDKGILLINMPTHNCLMSFIIGQNWLPWCPHIHVFFYAKKTLNDIITKNSHLKPVYIHQKSRLEPPSSAWAKSKLKDFIANFAGLIDKGEQLEAVYRKI